jgi:Calx-beta domain
MKNTLTLKRIICVVAASVAIAASVSTLKAQNIIYTEDFQTDHSLDNTWVTNSLGGYNPVNLYFDYSTVGIPSAPNSGGTTRGLKMQANLSAASAVFPSGVTVTPVGFPIAVNFEMRWDWWLNYNGPLNGGGSGSTQIGGGGFGTAGTSAQIAGASIDSFFFGASGDGTGTTADYRVYSPSAPTSHPDDSGVYAAGTVGSRNNSHAYYQTVLTPQSATNNCPAQLLAYPQQTGLTQGGSAGMKWRSAMLQKVGNSLTYWLDGLLIATVDVTTNGTLGGNNIVFGQFDINASASTDVNATNLAFSLVDNVRITDYTNVVTITNTVSAAYETNSAAGVFTINRTAAGAAITVNYTIGGTAVNGVDYTNALGGALSGTITFDAAATSTNITIIPVDDATPEALETVVLAISPSLNYVGAGNATVAIVDNEPAQLAITNVSTQMYERTNDYASFKVSRLGDTGTVFNVNLSFTGSATEGTDYYTNTTVAFDAGVLSTNINIYPIVDAANEGNETVTVSLAAAGAGEYTIGAQGSASITLVDANTAPEVVLFLEDFNVDHSADWNVVHIANNGIPDYNVDFNFPYTAFGIPEAPHGGGNGVFMNVNKDATGVAAALNLYPVSATTYSGNYALRFDMFLSVPLPSTVATEYALAGINHTGTKTNWFRSGGISTNQTFDGLFATIITDANATPNYGLYGATAIATNNPTLLTSQTATAIAAAFKANPYGVAGTVSSSNGPAAFFATPTWADVEISQIGNVVSLRINRTLIYSYTNATGPVSGKIMVGYEDAFDSISANQSYMVLDNIRVVTISPPVITLQPVNTTNAVGTPATLTAAATTTTTVTNYQWFRNGVAIVGATNASYSVASVAVANYGSYRVEVSDGSYTTVSSTAVISSPGLSIVTQPTSVVIAVNLATSFSVGIGGTSTGVTNYQWQLASTNLLTAIATNNPYNFTSRATNYGTYRVIVSDGFLSVTSAVATLTPPTPVINIQPTNRFAVYGSSPTLSVTATTSSGVTNYQWFYYGTNVSGAGISGATTRILTLAGIQPVNFNGPYTVRVNDGTTSITSAPSATITLAASPTVTPPATIGANLVFGYPSQLGPNYVTDFKSALTNATWIPIKTNAGTGATINITNALSGDQGYFRIRLQ